YRCQRYCNLLYIVCCFYFFFFSSRRRHTRCLSDWSSDVCSSDLQPAAPAFQAAPAPAPGVRPCVRGKFLFVGDEKLYVRGVTYGAFTPDAAGNEYHDLATVERDFALMAANGINAVRIPHTTPPRALL